MNNLDDFNRGIRTHSAIVGLKNTGKTTAILHCMESLQNAIYIDCEYILGTPKNFAYRALGTILMNITADTFSIFDRERIKKAAKDSKNDYIREIIQIFDSADDETILHALFSLFDKLNGKYIVFLDEFQKLLKLNQNIQITIF